MASVKLALLGCGAIAKFHLNGITEHVPRIEVTTAIDQLKKELEAGTISEEEYASRVEAVPWDEQRKWQKKTDLRQTRLSMELTAKEFGATAGAIGIVIVLILLLIWLPV